MSLYVDIEKQLGDFNLKVKFETSNEVFALLGASGCGKSLTLKCIAGVEKPDRGIIKLDDKVLFDSDKRINLPARKRKAGYLFQDYALFPNMTVFQNIMCGAKEKKIAEEYMERFYLSGKENLYPSQLSGGQKQRVALARMLAIRPDIIMLDEPFSALDNHLKSMLERELMNILFSYERPAILVSHDRNEVYRMTDKIGIMEAGQLIETEEKQELFDNPKSLAATLLTGCKNITRVKLENDGTYTASDWGIRLKTESTGLKEVLSSKYIYAAFRAHYFEVVSCMEEYNVMECEILREIEDIFSTVIMIKNKNSENVGDYSILTFELSKEKWKQIKETQINKGRLYLKIPKDKLILLER